jgi:general secretion pathway protein C
VKRAAPWIVLLLLTLVGGGAGYGVNAALRVLVAPDGEGPAPVERAGAAEEAPVVVVQAPAAELDKRAYIDGILSRNLFDSSAIGQASSSADGPTTLADLNVKLIGTMVAIPASYSAALIAEDQENAQPLVYGVGDMIEDAEIVAIEAEQVTVRRGDGSTQILSMTEVTAPTARPTATATEGEEEGGVRQVAENSYEIDRELVDRYLTDLDSISRMGRAIPHRGADGEVDGYRLSGIRRRSIGDQIGIKNGDIVHTVNGQPLTSMQGAMAAYQSMSSQSRFTFEVTRRGQRMTLSYDVR